tara:strand:- start:647 stop:901 length:255 start_codon:yes stop_codon:yes gene_type:complete
MRVIETTYGRLVVRKSGTRRQFITVRKSIARRGEGNELSFEVKLNNKCYLVDGFDLERNIISEAFNSLADVIKYAKGELLEVAK